MTQQDKRFKWLCYALGVIPVWLVETMVLSRAPLFGVIPVLLPLCAVAVGLWEGESAGAWFGLGVGIWADAIYPGLSGGMTLGLALLGWLTGLFSRHGMGQNYAGYLICATLSYGLMELCRVLSALLGGLGTAADVAAVALKEGLWSLCFTAPVYLLFRAIYRKVGGTTLGG